MTEAGRTVLGAHYRRCPRPYLRGAVVVLLGLALVIQAGAAVPSSAPGRDLQRKASPPTQVAPRFDLGDDVRDPFLPSAILQDPNAAPSGNGPEFVPALPAVPVQTGPVTLEELVDTVTVQGIYRGGAQTLATVNGNLVQAGATMPLTVRGQACPVVVVMIDALAQKVLFKHGDHVFERKLNAGRPAGGGGLPK